MTPVGPRQIMAASTVLDLESRALKGVGRCFVLGPWRLGGGTKGCQVHANDCFHRKILDSVLYNFHPFCKMDDNLGLS